jgi:hypothetical protein
VTIEQDKRREQRRTASGRVRINFTDPEPCEIAGKLIDVSVSGFRMKHDYASLRSGQIVRFTHAEAKGEAQVVWNRILAGGVETGFRVVAEPSAETHSQAG